MIKKILILFNFLDLEPCRIDARVRKRKRESEPSSTVRPIKPAPSVLVGPVTLHSLASSGAHSRLDSTNPAGVSQSAPTPVFGPAPSVVVGPVTLHSLASSGAHSQLDSTNTAGVSQSTPTPVFGPAPSKIRKPRSCRFCKKPIKEETGHKFTTRGKYTCDSEKYIVKVDFHSNVFCCFFPIILSFLTLKMAVCNGSFLTFLYIYFHCSYIIVQLEMNENV